MSLPNMVAADTPDRGRMWYLVDANLDFIPEVKLFLDWKAATRRAPATIKAYCSRLLWYYRFLDQHQLLLEDVTATHLTEFVIWLQQPFRSSPQGGSSSNKCTREASSVNLILQAVAALYRFLESASPTHPIAHRVCYCAQRHLDEGARSPGSHAAPRPHTAVGGEGERTPPSSAHHH